MVIIRTSAIEVSIQAVSPELARISSSAFASQAAAGAGSGRGRSGAAGAAAGAGGVPQLAAYEGWRNDRRPREHVAPNQPQAPQRLSLASLFVSCPGVLAVTSGRAGFTGADAHRVTQAKHEDLAVADLSGLGGPADGGSMTLSTCSLDTRPRS